MDRPRTTLISVVVFLTLGTGTTLQAQERMRAGMWENTITTAGHSATSSSCLKPTDAAKGSTTRTEAEKEVSKSGCTLKDYKWSDASTATQTMVCGNDTISTVTKFRGSDSVETTVTHAAGVTQIKGRRTGDC